MRILIPVHAFPPKSRFGGELYTYYLARELTALGADVHVMFTEPQAENRTYAYDGLTCTVVQKRRRTGPAELDAPDAGVEAAFQALLRTFKPDIVHFNHLLDLSPALPEVAKSESVPVVFTLHDYWLRCPKVKLLDRWGERCVSATPSRCASCVRHRYSRFSWGTGTYDQTSRRSALKTLGKEVVFQLTERPAAAARIRRRDAELRAMVPFVDCFIAPSRFLADRMADWGIPRERLMYCDYGTMELTYASPSRAKGQSPLRFGYLGAVSPEKGVHVLLEAFRGFHEASLDIFGATLKDLKETYPALADVLSQPNVEAKGLIDDAAKVRLLPDLDALVVASVWFENSPVVIHEAFLAGVPVICSDIGGMAELVSDGVDGLHFRAGDAASLRRVLRQCTDDPLLLGRLAKGIRPPTGMREHVVQEIAPIYETLVGRPPLEAQPVGMIGTRA
jgi:glycosyltransferase involved in cell wall biosynthesis